jgi:hypothetical protein
VCVLFLAASASGTEKQACVKAYEQAQILRKAHDLRGAREQLAICARDVCPTVLKHDCVPWLVEVTSAMPSVVIEVSDTHGATVDGAKVLIDDTPVTSGPGSAPIELNPGAHRVRVEAPGAPPVDESVDLAEGDKGHRMHLSLGVTPLLSPSLSPSGARPSAPLPLAAIAFGGVGVLGLATFAIFGVTGNGKKSDLDAEKCSPNCPASAVSAIKADYIAADVSLGVGLASLAVATYFFLTRPTGGRVAASMTGSAAGLGVVQVPGGGILSLTQRF